MTGIVTKREWLNPPAIEAPPDLVQELGLSPRIAGVLVRRGMMELKSARGFLDPNAYNPSLPSELPDLEAAAARLLHAIRRGEKILVWGDFDVDGQTATALLVDGLRDLGGEVSYHIPIRAQESHGVSLPVLRQWLEGSNPPHLVITCDTGITAFDAAEYACSQRVDMLITDHHELARQPESGAWRIPCAGWVVTPRFLAAGHPLATLPGVGVAFKLVEALFSQAGRPETAKRFYDLVALGIVADVAHQTGDARYLLQRGLEQLRSRPRLGLEAIYERAELNPHGLSEEHIGFVIAPRLNALGRLGDANPAVELLTTTDRGRARLLALQLEGLNARRQLLTKQVLRGSLAQLQQNRAMLDEPALVLVNSAWEPGVIGIVASRLVELYSKPVVMISSAPGEPGRGSARSVEGVDITRAIASQAGLLLGFGGHAMAAGFSIPEANIPAFQRGLNRAVAEAHGTTLVEHPPLQIDAVMPWEDLSLETVAEIERLAPFGPGNPPLTLASRDLRLISQAALGREQEHVMFTVEDANGLSRRVIWWGGADFLDSVGMPKGFLDLAYRVRSRTYRGSDDLQLEFVDFRAVSAPIEIVKERPVVDDYRLEEQPMAILKRIVKQPLDGEIVVWVEGKATELIAGHLPEEIARHRQELTEPIHTLVIWTSPPSAADLRAVLHLTNPKRIILIGIDPEEASFQVFTSRLAGLARYVIARQGGRTHLKRIAAATAQRELAVLRGLEWLAAQGHFSVLVEGDEVIISPGSQADHRVAALLFDQLRDLFEETRAYRSFFRRAEDPFRPE